MPEIGPPGLRWRGLETADTAKGSLRSFAPVLDPTQDCQGARADDPAVPSGPCGRSDPVTELCLQLLGRPASESGTSCHVDGAQGPGDRLRMSFRLPVLSVSLRPLPENDGDPGVRYGPMLIWMEKIPQVKAPGERRRPPASGPTDQVLGRT